MLRRKEVWISATCLAALVLVIGLGEVVARRAEDVFAGKVLILRKKPPSYFKTKGAFVSFLRKHSTKKVYQNEENTWAFETMSFFKRPLGDYEVEMVFYDVDDGKTESKRRFVDSYPQYTQDRNTRILFGKTTLVRPTFDAGKDYMLIAVSKGKELAKGEFRTFGTSQAMIDEQKRMEAIQKKMEEDMKELERKAKEQEQQRKNDEAAKDLF
jgi:hypothetical protein